LRFAISRALLRAAHAEALRRAARQIEPCAPGIGEAPRAGVVDAHDERASVVRIGDGETRAERPAARRGGVAVGVEALAGRGALAGAVVAGQHFLPGAGAGRLDAWPSLTRPSTNYLISCAWT